MKVKNLDKKVNANKKNSDHFNNKRINIYNLLSNLFIENEICFIFRIGNLFNNAHNFNPM